MIYEKVMTGRNACQPDSFQTTALKSMEGYMSYISTSPMRRNVLGRK